MKFDCVNIFGLRHRFGVVLMVGLSLMISACGSIPKKSAAGEAAPRSTVSRANALALAQMMAATVGGQVYTIAATGSMRPTLDESSVVTVEWVNFAQLQRGDIVIYRSAAGAPIIHRLYQQQGAQWLVLGDNNGLIDAEAVHHGNFIGRVCAIFYTSTEGDRDFGAALARP